MNLYYRQWNDLEEEDLNDLYEEAKNALDFYQEEVGLPGQECPYCSRGCDYCLMTRGL